MLKTLKQCLSWLNWQTAITTVLVIVGIVVYTGLPTISVLSGAVPLLAILVCLLPCLSAIVLLRKKSVATVVKPEQQQE